MENIERLFLSSKLKSNGVMIKSKVVLIFLIMKNKYDFKNKITTIRCLHYKKAFAKTPFGNGICLDSKHISD